MKRLAAAMLIVILLLSMSACQSKGTDSQMENDASQRAGNQEVTQTEGNVVDKEEARILIAYFSLGKNAEYPNGIDASTSASLILDGQSFYGTTEYVANLIQEHVGGDTHMIQTKVPYPTDFDAVVDQNHKEIEEGILPELVESDLDFSKYDTVLIGYPIWATNAPQAIFSFLSEYDLSGKRIIPFCTHDGYGPGSSYEDIATAVPNASEVSEGLAIEAADVPSSEETVVNWLKEIGLDTTGQENVKEEETAIKITIGDTILEGVIYDTPLANEIKEQFPLTISASGFGGREFYGGVDFYPENAEGGQTTFENGDITYCEAHHNMAIFYEQTDDPELSVKVIPIGKVTSDLSVFSEFPSNIDITFSLAE